MQRNEDCLTHHNKTSSGSRQFRSFCLDRNGTGRLNLSERVQDAVSVNRVADAIDSFQTALLGKARREENSHFSPTWSDIMEITGSDDRCILLVERTKQLAEKILVLHE